MKRCILALGLLLTLPAVADHSDDFWSPYAEFGTRTNGYRQGAGGMLWTPILQDECWLLYGQGAAGHWWDNWTGGLGLGYRRIIQEMAFGINGFLDAARTNRHLAYGQVGLGLELFANGFDLFLNGYFPFESHHTLSCDVSTVLVPGNGTQLQESLTDRVLQERAYSGFDITTGYCIPVCGNALYLSAGYFYYSTRHAERIAGPRFGVEARIENLAGLGTELRVGGQYEYNRVFGNYGSASVGIRIPLGCPGKALRCCSPCDLIRRMGDPASRGGGRGGTAGSGILTGDTEFDRDNGNGPCIGPDGQPVDLYYVSGSATGGGDGTIGNPFTWEEAAAASTPFDIIALLGGDPIDATENFPLHEGQIMVGELSDCCPEVITPCGPLDIPLTGSRPNVNWVGEEEHLITAAPGVQILGFNTDGNEVSSGAINGNNFLGEFVSGALICDIGAIEYEGPVMDFNDGFNMNIRCNDISDSKQHAIEVFRPSGFLIIDQNMVDNITGGAQARAINVEDIRNAANIAITNNTIDGQDETKTGIFVEIRNDEVIGDVAVNILNNSPIQNIDGPGIHVRRESTGGSGDGGLACVVIDGNDLENIGANNQESDALLIEVENATPGGSLLRFDVKNNTITTTTDGANGIAFENKSNDPNDPTTAEGFFRGNTVTDVDGIGIRIAQDTGREPHVLTIEVDKNTIDGAKDEAVNALMDQNAEGILNLTMGPEGTTDQGNSDENPQTAMSTAYLIVQDGDSSDSTVCVTMQGNASDRTSSADVCFDQMSGTLNVFDLANLSAENNSMTVDTQGTVNDVANACPVPAEFDCPLPVVSE
jgi:Inverse autotransporter, beta-domain